MDILAIFRRMQNIFVRGDYQARASNGKLTAKQLTGEVNSELPNPQAYGFASKGIGGKTYTICNGGDRDSGTVILHELEGAPTLADNETAVWNNQGVTIVLKADGGIEMNATAPITLNTTSTIELNGTTFGGLVKVNDLTTKVNALIDELQAHTHFGSTTINSGLFTKLVATDYENEDVQHG